MFNSIRGYAFTQTQYQLERFRDVYPWLYAAVIIVPLALVAIGIELNFAGARYWNLILSLVPGIALGFVLLHPRFYPWLFGLGVLDKLTDGVPNTPRQVLTGGFKQLSILLNILGHCSLLAQTALMLLAIHQFEDRNTAYVAVLALIGMETALLLFVRFSGQVYGRIMLFFWVPLFVGALVSAMFFPNYFGGDIGYALRHIQGEQENQRREALAAPLRAKLTAGVPLTLEERITLQNLEDQERMVEARWRTEVTKAFPLRDGLGQEEFQALITPGHYTCRAEITARNPADLVVRINGIGVDLASTTYINGTPCNGTAAVLFGPDGRAILHFNLDADARAQVRGANRWVRITFTPA